MNPVLRGRLAFQSARVLAFMAVAAFFTMAAARPCAAQIVTTFLFSTDQNETFQSNSILEEEIWQFDTTQGAGSEISGPLANTGPSMFTAGEDINAFHWDRATGIYYLSTQSDAIFTDNSLNIDPDDIVRYDPFAAPGSRASIYFDPDLYGADGQVDAISFHSDGDLLISFQNDETFDGLSVLNGDILKFDPLDPVTTKSIFFSESIFTTGNEDIRGFHFESATEMYLTINGDAGLPGLATFSDADVALWNGISASIAIAEGEFGSSSGGFRIDAISAIPEPSSPLLLIAAAALSLRRRHR